MFYFQLDGALDELRISRNKLATESKIRPNTIADLVLGNVQRLDMFTLQSILDTLNLMAEKKGIERRFDMNDIIQYKYKGENGKYYIKID